VSWSVEIINGLMNYLVKECTLRKHVSTLCL